MVLFPQVLSFYVPSRHPYGVNFHSQDENSLIWLLCIVLGVTIPLVIIFLLYFNKERKKHSKKDNDLH